jgi:hypothetical protein
MWLERLWSFTNLRKGGELMPEKKKQTKLAKWGGGNVYWYVGVYTQRSAYWAEGNQIKTENRYRFLNRREMTADAMRLHSRISCTQSRIRSAIYVRIPVLLPYVGSFCHLWAIPLLLTWFGFAWFVVFVNYSYCIVLLRACMQEVCVTGTKYYRHTCNVGLWHTEI